MFSEQDIANRIEDLGRAITHDYTQAADAGEDIVMVALLRGGATFMADLARKVELPLELDYMSVSSYGNEATSSGEVKIIKDLTSDIEGKHVILTEDIVDSGLTLSRVIALLKSRNPLSLEVVVCLRKDVVDQIAVDCRYLGFVCPDEFVVGYGLDYAEHYRNLPYIGVLKPEIYS